MIWLIAQMWFWLLLAAVLGLIVGVWVGRPSAKPQPGEDLDVEVARLRSRVEELNAERARLRSRVAELEVDGGVDSSAPETVPTFYKEPIHGAPDDLKRIKGIGPRLEEMLNSLGVFYYSQIAGWNQKQAADVDQKLTAFRGRIKRDNWQGQAAILAEGGETEFSRHYVEAGPEFDL